MDAIAVAVAEERAAIARRLREKAAFYSRKAGECETIEARNLFAAMESALQSFANELLPPDSSGSGGRVGG